MLLRIPTAVPIVVLIACSGRAGGQSILFLSPESFQVATDAPTLVHLEHAVINEDKPEDDAQRMENDRSATETQICFSRAAWPVDGIAWFFIRAGGTQINQDSVRPVDDAGESIRITFDRPGVAMIGFDTRPRIEEIDPDQFRRFLRHRVADTDINRSARAGGTPAPPSGGTPAPPSGGTPAPPGSESSSIPTDRPLRVRRSESAKTILRVTNGAGDAPADRRSAISLSQSGQTAEIRPLIDPLAADVGGELIFEILLDAPAADELAVFATHRESGRQIVSRADGSGLCQFRFQKAGTWYLEAHAAWPILDDGETDETAEDSPSPESELVTPDWELITATLSFRIGDENQSPAHPENDEH